MTSAPSGILFAFSTGDQSVTRRGASRLQRILADGAETQLDARMRVENVAPGIVSRSHSRMVALAAACWSAQAQPAAVCALGADVEFVEPRRAWREITHAISGIADVQDQHTACRAWTLCEAWYKAFGVWPVPALVRRALYLDAQIDQREPIALAASTFWARLEVVEHFQASIVWRGAPVIPSWAGAGSALCDDATNGSAS